MNFLRKHWYDVGIFFAVITAAYIIILHAYLSNYQMLMWLNLIALFLHQSEEYRIGGTFPGMVNTVMYHSVMPDRYPLNTNAALWVNVGVGWLFYLFAAILG